MRGRSIVVAVLLIAAVGCTEAEPITERVRFPDDEGMVTDMTLERVQLGGDRTYRISSRVESFRSRSHEVTSLLFWEGKYVQVGLDGNDEVAWIAGLGTVTNTEPPLARYSGVFVEVDADTGRAVFEDGTTLALAGGVEPPEPGREVAVTIDPTERMVIEVVG